jgi:hypothetical protein
MRQIEITNNGSKQAYLFATIEDYMEWANSKIPLHMSSIAAIVPITAPAGTQYTVNDMYAAFYDNNWHVVRTYDTPQEFKGVDVTGKYRNLSYKVWILLHPNFKLLD